MAKLVYGGYCAEYSFAEPRYFVLYGNSGTDSWEPSPSIHFRHWGQASVGWADGHSSSEKMGRYDGINNDGIKPSKFNIGWFEPLDNSLFDLQ
jgi:prepilin-type processing-associated H-X9-DG protein